MRVARVVIAGYIIGLTLALLAGRWPLQGPVLLSFGRNHGLHLGDTLVLLVSGSVALVVLSDR